jgi:hypothetical protein
MLDQQQHMLQGGAAWCQSRQHCGLAGPEPDVGWRSGGAVRRERKEDNDGVKWTKKKRGKKKIGKKRNYIC